VGGPEQRRLQCGEERDRGLAHALVNWARIHNTVASHVGNLWGIVSILIATRAAVSGRLESRRAGIKRGGIPPLESSAVESETWQLPRPSDSKPPLLLLLQHPPSMTLHGRSKSQTPQQVVNAAQHHSQGIQGAICEPLAPAAAFKQRLQLLRHRALQEAGREVARQKREALTQTSLPRLLDSRPAACST
jgi:hypothetical protein